MSKDRIVSVLSALALAADGLFIGLVVIPQLTEHAYMGQVKYGLWLGSLAFLNIIALLPSVQALFEWRASSQNRLKTVGVLRFFLALLVLAGFTIGAFSVGERYDKWLYRDARDLARKARLLNKVVPNLEGTTLEGKPWRIADERGKVIVLDFWATWCGPCRARMPDMRALHARYAGMSDVEFVGVSLDKDRSRLESYCRDNGVTWPQLFQTGKGCRNDMASALEVHAIPSVWVIDRKGVIRVMDAPGVGFEEDLAKIITHAR